MTPEIEINENDNGHKIKVQSKNCEKLQRQK